MSVRTLIEINHDFTWRLDDQFLADLKGYLSSGSTRSADGMREHGLTIIAQRHHSGDFHFDPKEFDGFAGLEVKK